MPKKILLVDDEIELLAVLKRSLTRQGYSVHTASSVDEAWDAITVTMYDLIISDLSMDGKSGLDLLKQLRTIDTLMPFIIMTGAGSIDTAVAAIQHGAYHYITKPFDSQELINLSKRAIEHGVLHRKLEGYAKEDELKNPSSMVIGNNHIIHQIMTTLNKVAKSEASILIQGETGTGKSLFAKHIHQISHRADKPFYTIDCGTLSESLLESELFGHVKGAFTNAVRAKRGLLEEAQEGTIFLDEIGELTPATQVKLLRAIQEKEIKPVGGNVPINIDVRFLAATSRDLEKEVETGQFRKDLYYRLAVIPLRIPSLRERQEDISLFVDKFVQKYATNYNKQIKAVSPSTMQIMLNSPWKGNIRELENVIERAVLLTDGDVINPEALGNHSALCCADATSTEDLPETLTMKKAVEIAECKAIKHALIISKNNKSQAAKILGIGRRTIYEKISVYNLD